MAETGRGMNPVKEQFWKDMYRKEDFMRLKWFHKNQQRLIEITEQEASRKGLSPQVLAEVEKLRQARYRNMERHGKKKALDIELPEIDPNCILNVMKPIDPKVTRLLFTNLEKEGRKNYLQKRYSSKPEDRYYFPETINFQYGWKFSDLKSKVESKFGRKQIIKNSFYRRNGALMRDPDFYREPQEDSPTICKC